MSTSLEIWFAEPGRIEFKQAARAAPAPGEVGIRSQCSLISPGTELSLLHGPAEADSAWAEFGRYPRQVGYSNAGIVESVGEGVDEAWIGARVATRAPHAAWVNRPLADLRVIPDSVGFDEACFSTLAGVAMNGLRRAALSWGESVGVIGLGLVGQLAARVALAAGAGPVFGFDVDASRLQRLRPAGALPMTSLEAGAVSAANRGRLLDLVIEASACAESIPRQIELIRDEGRLLMLSSPRGAAPFDFHDGCNRRSISIVGAHGFSQPKFETAGNPWTSPRHGELFLDWLAAGRLSVKELISHRLPAQRVAEGYELLASKSDQALGVVLQWT